MGLKVMLVGPLPPPHGGIATWTKGLLQYALRDSELEVVHLDSSMQFRGVLRQDLTSRLVSGIAQVGSLTCKFAVAMLLKRPKVIHVCSSASFGLYRDIVLASLARCMRVPFGDRPTLR